MSIAIQRSKTKVNKHILPILEWAKVLHAAVISGSVISPYATGLAVQQQNNGNL